MVVQLGTQVITARLNATVSSLLGVGPRADFDLNSSYRSDLDGAH